MANQPVSAEEDDWNDRRWEDEPGAADDEPAVPMALGAQSLPSGHFALRMACGYPFLSAGMHAGLIDGLNLTAEAMTPLGYFAKAVWMGGGVKWSFLQQGRFGYALAVRAFGVLYQEPGDDVLDMAPGVFLWPSFLLDMQVPRGRIHGEIGTILYTHVGAGAKHDYLFFAVPMRFGGEIVLRGNLHAYANLEMAFNVIQVQLSGAEAGILVVF